MFKIKKQQANGRVAVKMCYGLLTPIKKSTFNFVGTQLPIKRHTVTIFILKAGSTLLSWTHTVTFPMKNSTIRENCDSRAW